MTMFNWPLYIEDDDAVHVAHHQGLHRPVPGSRSTYQSNIDGNDTFTTKYQPDLQAATASAPT